MCGGMEEGPCAALTLQMGTPVRTSDIASQERHALVSRHTRLGDEIDETAREQLRQEQAMDIMSEPHRRLTLCVAQRTHVFVTRSAAVRVCSNPEIVWVNRLGGNPLTGRYAAGQLLSSSFVTSLLAQVCTVVALVSCLATERSFVHGAQSFFKPAIIKLMADLANGKAKCVRQMDVRCNHGGPLSALRPSLPVTRAFCIVHVMQVAGICCARHFGQECGSCSAQSQRCAIQSFVGRSYGDLAAHCMARLQVTPLGLYV